MNRHARRARKMSRAQKDRMQGRAARKLKGMTFRGWLADGELLGQWRFGPAHKPRDRPALVDYAEHAPFRWRIQAVARCQAVDAHGKVETYDDSQTVETGQCLLMAEILELCAEAMREAMANTNPNHVVQQFYIIAPIV